MTGWQLALLLSVALHGVAAVIPLGGERHPQTPAPLRLTALIRPAAATVAKPEPLPRPLLRPAPATAVPAAHAPKLPATPTAVLAARSPPDSGPSIPDKAGRSASPSSSSPELLAVDVPPATVNRQAAATHTQLPAAYAENPPPVYPRFARERGQHGRVLLGVLVGVDGRPSSISIRLSSGFSLLDQAAKSAVEQWRFVPARRGENPVEALVDVPVIFRLANG